MADLIFRLFDNGNITIEHQDEKMYGWGINCNGYEINTYSSPDVTKNGMFLRGSQKWLDSVAMINIEECGINIFATFLECLCIIIDRGFDVEFIYKDKYYTVDKDSLKLEINSSLYMFHGNWSSMEVILIKKKEKIICKL